MQQNSGGLHQSGAPVLLNQHPCHSAAQERKDKKLDSQQKVPCITFEK